MCKHIWRVLLCALALRWVGTAAAWPDYLQLLDEAVTKIELGAYDEAAAGLEKAFALDDSDPLGHMALATIYLHAGRLDDATKEYKEVLAARPGEWRAQYALALIALVRNDQAKADEWLASARQLADLSPEPTALDGYLQFLRSGKSDSPSASPLGQQVAAMAALRMSDPRLAMSLLKEVLQAPATPGFEENRGPIATFDPNSPVVLPSGKLMWKSSQPEDLPVLSGLVTLNADTSKTPGVRFVTFYVDDIFMGVTNYEPFEFDWNTVNHPNGVHQVRIEGRDQAGNAVSKKTTRVRLVNANPKRNPPRSGPEVDALGRRLWNCTRLVECRKLAHYHLAKLHLASGENEAAAFHFETVVAYQSDFRDARKQLNDLRGRLLEYREIRRGPEGSKAIALTFDDGPNERTWDLLSALAKLGVRATFFVVGFRAEAQPELVKAIAAAGHEVENHTYNHPNLTGLSVDAVERELVKTSAAIRGITGKSPAYFRPPGGHCNDGAGRAAARHGLTGVFWTINCTPYEGGSHVALAGHVIANASDGGIVLMHNGESAATAALPMVVEQLQKRGYHFVTISEMAAGR